MRCICWGQFLLLLSCVAGLAAQGTASQKRVTRNLAAHDLVLHEDFALQLKTYYCAASWICREFEQMTVQELVVGWQQVVTLLTSEQYNWFYAYDNPTHYQKRCNERHSTLARYVSESIDAEWLRECMDYHKFITTYFIDTQRNVVVQIDRAKVQASERRFVDVRAFLMSTEPETLALFYQFFYQQLSNVMINKMSYIYESTIPLYDQLDQLLKDHELLSDIYYLCNHSVDSSPTLAQKLASNYQTIESMEFMVALKLIKGV